MRFYHELLHWFMHILSQPAEQASRWHKAVRFAWDLARYCARQLREDRAGEMAAALTYRTIFSLVPFFVLALIVFRAFGGFEVWGQNIQTQIYDYLGVSTVAVQQADRDDDEPFVTPHHDQLAEREAASTDTDADTDDTQPTDAPASDTPSTDTPATDAIPPDDALALDAAADQTRGQEELRLTLEQVFDQLNEQVAQVSFTSIGVVGIVLLIWAALALAVQVEDGFNQVYRATSRRPWHLRIAIYWSLITLGPVLLALSLWLTGVVVGWFGDMLALGSELPGFTYYAMVVIGWVLSIISQLAAFLAGWLLLFLLYVLMPNTTVHLRPAVIGAMVAAALWEIAKSLFGLYVSNAVGYTALYGTLALIPLFLFWVYLTWLIVLFGLELTYTLQTLKGRRLKEIENKNKSDQDLIIDPRWVIPVMTVIGDGFEQGKAMSLTDVQDRTALPTRVLTRLTDQLKREGLLHQVQDPSTNGDARYTLAMPPDTIPIERLLHLGRSLSDHAQAALRVPAHALLTRLSEAEHQAAQQLTLANVIEQQAAMNNE